MVIDAHAEYKEAYVVEQLRKYPQEKLDKPIVEMSYKELVNQLARLRAMEVEIDHSDNKWF